MSENGGRAGRVTRRWQGVVARVRGIVRGFAAWLRSRWQRLVAWVGLPMAITVTVLGLVFAIIAIGLLAAFALALLKAIGAGTELEGDAIRNIGLALAAFIGVPVLVWRNIVADRQARIADAALFNEKIHAASNDLHAVREITRGETNTPEADVKNIREDDVTRRNTAIDRLESLAKERPEEAPRIGRMLSVYLRELSREYPPKEPRKEASREDLDKWARGLEPTRSDMERAAQSIGRLLTIDGMTPERLGIDLSEINMQGFRLNSAALRGAKLAGARLEGANLVRAQLQGANLAGAHLKGAGLTGAQLQGADLTVARLQGANLYDAQLQDAILYNARFNQHTIFLNADTSRAALGNVVLTDTNITNDQTQSMFGDGSVTLPDTIPAPEHWPCKKLKLPSFLREWRRYQQNPAAYIPPQNRPGTV